jgi:hypothetical protein
MKFENGVLRRIHRPKRGSWRKLHNEELHNLYASPDIIRAMKSRRLIGVQHIAHIEQMRNIYTILFEKCEGQRPFGRPQHR